MNNKSGSVLQRANFLLLVLVLVCLAYLIVRERARSDQRAAEDQIAAKVAATSEARAATQAETPWNPAEMKSSFAPLRSRNGTNVVRVVTNRVPVVLRTGSPTL